MKPSYVYLLAVLCAAAPIAARAQASTTAPNAPRRETAIERQEAIRIRKAARAAMTPEQRQAARAQREARIAAMPPEQQQYMRDLRAYQQELRLKSRELHAQVSAGTATREAMAQELKSFRSAHRPSRPAGMPDRKRTP